MKEREKKKIVLENEKDDDSGLRKIILENKKTE
jgi:hypothetical protein